MNRQIVKLFLIVIGCWLLAGCGPVVISSRPHHPPPPWFYPDRVEMVRYVYFPDISIYYDLTDSVYIYLDGSVWTRAIVLPPRYRNYDLHRRRYIRVRDYYGDNIREYHQRNPKVRSNQNSRKKGARNSSELK